MFDPQVVKRDFPLLQRQIHGKPLVYLDNAATSQKPRQVIDAITHYYQHSNANVHRGIHQLADESTRLYQRSRQRIAEFFGAQDEELILVRNTTEAINGVAYAWADSQLKESDVILLTLMEHHSDLVVWQEVCRRTGARLQFVPVDAQGRLDLKALQYELETSPIKLVAVAHVSNVLGTVNPIARIVELVKATEKSRHAKIRILVDGAQAAPHLRINFSQLGVDFYIFSGHKMLGPMGSGGLLVKRELIDAEEMKPWLFGGGMIESVTKEQTKFHEDPCERFTAGTPDVASALGLAAACNYLSNLGMGSVEQHDRSLVAYALERLSRVPQLTMIGPTKPLTKELDRLGSVAFLYKNIHAHDVAQVLDSEGIAVRSGHHCTMPLHLEHHWQATTRASFQVYNTGEDIDALVAGLSKVAKVFG